MNPYTFNLVNDPWITSLFLDGTTKDLSLTELFEQAEEVFSISGINNINTVSINHFLSLLVLKVTGGFETVKEFKDILTSDWTKDVIGYLKANVHLFNIYDEHYPFLQNAGLREHVQSGSVTDYPWFRIRSCGLKEIRFASSHTILNPPQFEGKEVAQFLLTEAFFAGGGGCHTYDKTKLEEAGFKANAVKTNASPRLNTRTVAISDCNFAKTVLLNIPNIKASSNYQAPWERQQSVIPVETTVDTTLDIMSYQPKTTLLKWDNEKVVGVFSAQSLTTKPNLQVNKNHLPFALIDNASDKKEEKYSYSELNNTPWDDFETIFVTNEDISVAGKRSPAILSWWALLQNAGLLSDSVLLSTITTLCTDSKGNVRHEIRVRNQTIPATILNSATRQGSSLLSLFQFISDINRRCFGAYGSQSLSKMKPLQLLANGQRFSGSIESRFPCSEQFLTYSKIIFEEALEHSFEASTLSKESWQAIMREYKKRIIKAAETVWSATILSIPLSTLTSCRAVGRSQQKLSKILHHYRKETIIEKQ